jgi:hypothetical protein
MESLLIVPKSSEELDFLKALLAKLNVGVLEVKENFSFEEIPMSEVYALGVESMREEWDTPENRVWNSLVTENE